MTSSFSDSCEYCGAHTQFTNRAGRRICDDCGLLQGSTLSREQTGDSPSTSKKRDSRREYTNGPKSISYRDSSEETLGEMILNTESLIKELGGDASQCAHSAEMISEAWQTDYFRGRSSKVGIASIVYSSFRIIGLPRPLSIVAETSGLSSKQLRHGLSTLRSHLELPCETLPVSSYVGYLSMTLELDEGLIQRGLDILERASGVSGNPSGIAAAALYLAAKESDYPLTLSRAGSAAGVTKETVWRKSKEIRHIGDDQI